MGVLSRAASEPPKPHEARPMSGQRKSNANAVFPPETFRFFRELARNNRKAWMDQHRDRYREVVVRPMREMLERLTPAILRLDPRFDVSGRTGRNFSRINRDIRFARDKSPYRPQMYLKFGTRAARESEETGELYVGVAPETVTAGFRIYHRGRRSPAAARLVPRATEHRDWLERQRRRLARRYESYWYATERGEWTKHSGWPLDPAEWKKLKGWVVRRKLSPAAACRPAFATEIERIFRDLVPLHEFTSFAPWEP